ncbi:hypothetical protein BJX70DRAFT_357059 [Aspergillus crustosus]
MEESFVLGGPKPPTVRLKKACDHCRRSKIRCEKIEGSPSCTACEKKGCACIISSNGHHSSLTGVPAPSFCSLPPVTGQDASSFISFRQKSKILLHDWIYGNIRTRDLQGIPNLLKDVREDYQQNLTFAFSHLAVVEEQAEAETYVDENISTHVPFPLPPEAEILQIILTYSQCTSLILPLFKDEVAEWLANQTYLDPRLRNDVATWAALNIALAMGYTMHLLQNPDCHQDVFKYKQHLQNALATIPRLIMGTPTLTSVQALYGMAYLLNSNFELPSTHALLAIAIQQAHTLGIHRPDLAEHETNAEQRKRIFWIGYILDKTICSAQGLGPYEDEANSLIALPEADTNPGPNTNTHTQNNSLPLFTLLSRLSIIKGRIFKTVYTNADAETNPNTDPHSHSQSSPRPTPTHHPQHHSTSALESNLTAWRQSLPAGIETSLGTVKSTSSTKLAIVVLLLTYHQAIITLYKPIYLHFSTQVKTDPEFESGDGVDRLRAGPRVRSRPRPVDIRVLACVNSARKTAALVKFYPVHVPLGGRSLLSYVFTSLVIMTMHILDDPAVVTATRDLQLVREMVAFISALLAASHTIDEARLESVQLLVRASRHHLESAERAIRGVREGVL